MRGERGVKRINVDVVETISCLVWFLRKISVIIRERKIENESNNLEKIYWEPCCERGGQKVVSFSLSIKQRRFNKYRGF